MNLICIVSRAMAFPHGLSDHGYPIWIGKGDDDKEMLAQLPPAIKGDAWMANFTSNPDSVIQKNEIANRRF